MHKKFAILLGFLILLALGGVWYGMRDIVSSARDLASLPQLTAEQKAALDEELKQFEHPEEWHEYRNDYVGYAIRDPKQKADSRIKYQIAIEAPDVSYRFSFSSIKNTSYFKRATLRLHIITKYPDDTIDDWIEKYVDVKRENIRNINRTVIAGYPALQFDSAKGDEEEIKITQPEYSTVVGNNQRILLIDATDKYSLIIYDLVADHRVEKAFHQILGTLEFYPPDPGPAPELHRE